MATSKFISIWKLMSQYIFEIDSESCTENMSCILCKRLLIDACQSACGCQFCHNCIKEYLQDGPKHCPGGKPECNEDVLIMDRDLSRNRTMNNKIYNLKVMCPNVTCQATIQLASVEEHLQLCTKQCMTCPYIAIGCDEDEDRKVSILSHLQNESLSHAKLLIKWLHDLKKEIEGFKENAEITRLLILAMKDELNTKDMEVKLISENMKLIKEQYERMEIQVRELREQLKSQKETTEIERNNNVTLARDSGQHNTDKDAGIIEIRTELAQMKNASKSKDTIMLALQTDSSNKDIQLVDMVQQIINLKKENIAARDESRNLKVIVDSLNRQMRDCRKETKMQFEGIRSEIEKRVKRKFVSNSMNQPRMKVEKIKATIEKIEMDTVSNALIGGLTFTVERFSTRKDGEKIVCPYFYSHSNGYKLQLWILPKQYGRMLSVCFVVCKGEFDQVLEWPCKSTINIGIVNQINAQTENTVTYNYATMHNNCKYIFLQPNTKNNHPYECRLISHENLRSHQGFIGNDCVVVKCSISQ